MRAKLSAKKPAARVVESMEKMLELAERIRAQLVKSNLRLVSVSLAGSRRRAEMWTSSAVMGA